MPLVARCALGIAIVRARGPRGASSARARAHFQSALVSVVPGVARCALCIAVVRAFRARRCRTIRAGAGVWHTGDSHLMRPGVAEGFALFAVTFRAETMRNPYVISHS